MARWLKEKVKKNQQKLHKVLYIIYVMLFCFRIKMKKQVYEVKTKAYLDWHIWY